MDKAIYTSEYAAMLELLSELREQAGLTQVELGELLGQSQSFVSKVERGERRLDLIQLRTICRSLGGSLPDFVKEWERRIAESKKR